MKNLSIKLKFYGGFGLVVLMFGAAQLVAWRDIGGIDDQVRQMYEQNVTALDLGRLAQRDFIDLRRHYLRGSSTERRQWGETYTFLHRRLDEDLRQTRLHSEAGRASAHIDRATALLTSWDSLITQPQTVDRDRRLDQIANDMQGELDANVDAARDSAWQAMHDVRSTISASTRLIAVYGIGTVVVAFLIAGFLAVDIIGALARAAGIARRIAAGQLEVAVGADRRDEAGTLFRALDHMRRRLHDNAEALKRLAVTDQLTQLGNRRFLDEACTGHLQHAERFGDPFALIITDVDKFKSVNDQHGHQVGDEVLKLFAKILRATVRRVDTVGRWGGEEFAILCPHTNHQGGTTAAEHIRAAIARHPFPIVGTKTASFGVAIWRPGDTIDDMVKRADEALYRAKENGRNRVETDAQVLPADLVRQAGQ